MRLLDYFRKHEPEPIKFVAVKVATSWGGPLGDHIIVLPVSSIRPTEDLPNTKPYFGMKVWFSLPFQTSASIGRVIAKLDSMHDDDLERYYPARNYDCELL